MLLTEFRQRYPQYDDLSDAELADGLYRKFYSDVPRFEFDQKIGLGVNSEPAWTGDPNAIAAPTDLTPRFPGGADLPSVGFEMQQPEPLPQQPSAPMTPMTPMPSAPVATTGAVPVMPGLTQELDLDEDRWAVGGAGAVDFSTSALPPIPGQGIGPFERFVSAWAPPQTPPQDALAPVPLPSDPYSGTPDWQAYPGLVVRGAAETGLTMGRGLEALLQHQTDETRAFYDEYLTIQPGDRDTAEDLVRRVQRSGMTPARKSLFTRAVVGAVRGEPPVSSRDLGIDVPIDTATGERYDRAREVLRETFPASQEQERSLLGQTMTGIGSTAGFLPFAAIPGGVWAAGALAGAGEAAERAYRAGASPEQQGTATALGMVPGAIDALSIDSIIRGVARTPGAAGWLRSIVLTGLRTGAIEGSTEGVQQAVQNVIARATYDPDAAIAEGVPENALVGFLSGGALGAAGGVFSRPDRSPVATMPDRQEPPALDPARAAPGVSRGTETERPAPDDAVAAAREARRQADEVMRRAAETLARNADRLGLLPDGSSPPVLPGPSDAQTFDRGALPAGAQPGEAIIGPVEPAAPPPAAAPPRPEPPRVPQVDLPQAEGFPTDRDIGVRPVPEAELQPGPEAPAVSPEATSPSDRATSPIPTEPRSSEPVPAPAAADAARSVPAAPVATFQTAKGSTYQLLPDGTTVRDKAARPEHPGDFGPQPRSDRTIYIDMDVARALAPPASASWRMIDHGDGTVSLGIIREDGRIGIPPSARNLAYQTDPAVGMVPLELWQPEQIRDQVFGYRKIHFGNEITAIADAAPPATPVPEPAAAPSAEARTERGPSADAAPEATSPSDRATSPIPTEPRSSEPAPVPAVADVARSVLTNPDEPTRDVVRRDGSSVPVTFPDALHAELYDFALRVRDGEVRGAPMRREMDRLFTAFRGWVGDNPGDTAADGEPFSRPRHVIGLARDYLDLVRTATEPGQVDEAGRGQAPDVIDPDRAAEYWRRAARATPATPMPAPAAAPSAEARTERGPSADAAPALAGPLQAARIIDSDTAITPAGTDVPVRYAVVELDSLIPSQTDDGNPNPRFTGEQPRDRSRAASQAQVAEIASRLDPRRLDRNPSTADGAPLVGPDGMVDSGNGRILAIRRAYRQGLPSAARYKQHLVEQGYPVEGMQRPVLVRINDAAPDLRARIASESNARSTLAMSATEQAMADARAMATILPTYRGGDVTAAVNRDFVRRFIDQAVGAGDRGSFVDSQGQLSGPGIRRIQAAMLAAAYGDANIVETLVESADSDIKAIGGALVDAAPAWAQMRQEAEVGQIDAEVGGATPDLLEAVRLVQRARAEGQHVADLAAQMDMFGGRTISPEGEAFLRLFFRDTRYRFQRGRPKIAQALIYYATEARKTQPGPGLFGDADRATPAGILENARRQADGPEQQQQGDLLQAGRRGDRGEGLPPAGGDPGRGAPVQSPDGAGDRGPAAEPARGADAGGLPDPVEPPSPSLGAADDLASPNDLAAPEPAEPAEPAPASAASRDVARRTARIEDFGERLEGARKDYAQRLRDAGSVDIATAPLSQSWPEPDYQRLLDQGASPWVVAFVHAARDEVPTKPQSGWKLQNWVNTVRALRGFASDLLDGKISEERLRQALRAPENERLEKGVVGRADLYAAVGHGRSLKGLRLTEGHYSMWNRVRYDPPKVVWTVERETSSVSLMRNWPRTVAEGATREEAVRNFKAAFDRLQDKPAPAKDVSFEIYAYRTGPKAGRWWIGKKMGALNRIDLRDFASAKEARAYLTEHQAELVEMLERAKKVPNERRETNAPRVGHDYRGGGDVSPDMFSATFGFRGVQFGNWVEGDRRQQSINEAFDGLMDLAGVLGIPPRALSLNGELGLAFGSRGRGGKNPAAAHFEPDKIVINLTKEHGAGSLAHEWWHSLDNYFARRRNERNSYLTQNPTVRGEGVRPEMVEAFREVMAALARTEIGSRSRDLDRRRSKPYWSTPIEMSARAFETYVIAKLQDQGLSNDYLANIVSQEAWDVAMADIGAPTPGASSYPYPTAGETLEIRSAFDNFFKVVETRNTEEGRVALYQAPRTPAPAPPFYSALTRGVEAVKIGRGPREQWLGIVRNLVQKGVKQAEIEWSGIETWLRDVEGPITKDKVLDYLRSQEVQVQEVVKGGPKPDHLAQVIRAHPFAMKSITSEQDVALARLYGTNGLQYDLRRYTDAEVWERLQQMRQDGSIDRAPESARTKWGEYTLPGGENYRELLLTLPPNPTREQIRPDDTAIAPLMPEWDRLVAAIRDARDRGDTAAEDALVAEQDALHARMIDATIDARGGLRRNYLNAHFEEPNILAHIRFNERTGPNGERVLFIEEIQSDWHQAGRKQGYQSKAVRPEELTLSEAQGEEVAAPGKYWFVAPNGARVPGWGATEAEARSSAVKFHNANAANTGVPDAPFKTTWHETAFRRMVRWAAENGFDRVAWTTGAMQTERFDLSKRVDAIWYKLNPDGTYRVSADVEGRGQMLGEAIPADRLDEYVGKEIAERIIDGVGTELDFAANNEPSDIWRSLKDVDLKVGGEGMRGFYDRILPAYANKFGKPFGARAETAPVSADGELAAHSLPITPEMRVSVLRDGVPLWQSGQEGAAPTTSIDPDALKAELRRIAPLASLEVIERIAVAGRGPMNGAYYPAFRGIVVAATAPDPMNSLRHEAIHALRDLNLIRPEEWRRLSARAEAEWIGRYDIEARYPGLSREGQIEEAVAEAFADHAETPLPPGLRGVWENVKRFLDRLGAWLRGQGFQTVDDVLGRIDSGEVGARDVAPGQGRGTAAAFQTPRLREDEAPGPVPPAQRSRTVLDAIKDGQPIDRILRLPFRLLGGVTERGEWKPGLRLADWGAEVITERKLDPNGRFAWLNPAIEKARAGLIDRYGQDPEYVARDRRRQNEETQRARQGLEIVRGLIHDGMDANEAAVLQAVLTGEPIPPGKWEKVAPGIRAAIDEMGAEAMALGLISAESYERNKGAYLNRSYLKHEATVEGGGLGKLAQNMGRSQRVKLIGSELKGRGIFLEIDPEEIDPKHRVRGTMIRVLDDARPDTTGKVKNWARAFVPAGEATPARFADWTDKGAWEVRQTAPGKLVLWRDYTKAERERMGEILDARYTIAKTFYLMAHDLATGRFYRDIATNEAWATKMQPPEGTWVNAREANIFAQLATDVEWVKVPDTEIEGTAGVKKWGALAGMYVRSEIWRDLNQVAAMANRNAWDYVLSQWKLNKTARSPVTHMNNVMSNVLFMDMNDVRLQDLVDGVRSYMAADQDFKEAEANGAFGTGFVGAEIRREVLEPILREIEAEATGKKSVGAVTRWLNQLGAVGRLMATLGRAVKKVDEKMLAAYRAEDDIFRMALYKRRRAMGDSVEAAANAAREVFLDYDIRAPWVNAARRTALPFIAYTYRAIPGVAKAIATKPWKLAKYAALAQLANWAAYAMWPGDEDEERRNLRKDQRGYTWVGSPRMMRLWVDSDGPNFLDIRRWIPAGDVFDLNQGSPAVPLPSWVQLGGPLQVGIELMMNRSNFTGKDIVNKRTDDGLDQTGKIADYLWKSWAPSAVWVPGGWYQSKVADALSGVRDRTGNPLDPLKALVSSFGIKVQGMDLNQAKYWRQAAYETVKRDLAFERNRAIDDHARGAMSDSAYRSTMADIAAKEKRAEAEVADILKDAAFQQWLRQFEAKRRTVRSNARRDAKRELAPASP